QVEDLEMALGRGPDVLGLEVAVDHLVAVGEVKGLGQRPENEPDLVQGQPAAATQQLVEGFARVVLKDNERLLVVEPEVIKGGDRGVGEVGSNACLFGKSLPHFGLVDGSAS